MILSKFIRLAISFIPDHKGEGGFMVVLKQMDDLKKIASNMQNQGKSDEQIKNAISLYLIESKKNINPNGDLDII
jgi:hypothetical protein